MEITISSQMALVVVLVLVLVDNVVLVMVVQVSMQFYGGYTKDDSYLLLQRHYQSQW